MCWIFNVLVWVIFIFFLPFSLQFVMEDFSSINLEIDELPDFNRQYLDSLVQLVSLETGNNCDYHKFHHYMLNKFTETWADEEKIDYQKEIGQREFACPRTCKFCGCVRRKLKIKTKKVKRIRRKFYILICKFCRRSILVNKQGTALSKISATKKLDESAITSESKVKSRRGKKSKKSKPKPMLEIETNVVPVIQSKKIEKFNQEDTIKQLNFLLKGGNGGKKLNFNELQRSKLMDLLI